MKKLTILFLLILSGCTVVSPTTDNSSTEAIEDDIEVMNDDSSEISFDDFELSSDYTYDENQLFKWGYKVVRVHMDNGTSSIHYMNRNFSISEKYLYATDFNQDGLAIVANEHGYGVINYKFETVISFEWSYLYGLANIDRLIGEKSGTYYLLDLNGTILKEFSPSTHFVSPYVYHDRTLLFREETMNDGSIKYYMEIIDYNGDTVTTIGEHYMSSVIGSPELHTDNLTPFNTIRNALTFSKSGHIVITSYEDNFSKILDLDGNVLLENPYSQKFTSVGPNLLISTSEGYVNLEGDLILDLDYYNLQAFCPNELAYVQYVVNGYNQTNLINTDGSHLLPLENSQNIVCYCGNYDMKIVTHLYDNDLNFIKSIIYNNDFAVLLENENYVETYYSDGYILYDNSYLRNQNNQSPIRQHLTDHDLRVIVNFDELIENGYVEIP